MATFEVRVTSVPEGKAHAIRALRVIGRMQLVKATELYGFLRAAGAAVVAAGLDKRVAEHVRRSLEEGGFAAEIAPSSMPSPMVLAPQVNAIYAWGPLRTLRRASSG